MWMVINIFFFLKEEDGIRDGTVTGVQTCALPISIYQAPNRLKAHAEFKAWKKAWQKTAPEAVHCLEKDLEEMLGFLDCPKSHQIKIRTTNAIERAFREVRRRTRVFSCFSNIASSERIIYAIFTHLNNNWKNKPLKQFTQFD